MFAYINFRGSIVFNFGTNDPLKVPAEFSCALDIVEKYGNLTLEQIGDIWQVSRERIRQIEADGLVKLRRRSMKVLEQFRD